MHGTILRPVVVYGGTSVGHQLRQLEFGCNILVSTPGRLVDFLNRKKVRFKVLIVEYTCCCSLLGVARRLEGANLG